MANGIQMTLEAWMAETFPEQTVGVLEPPAKTSRLPENVLDSKAIEALSLEKYLESLGKSRKKRDLNGCSMKMLRECLAATEDLTTLKFSLQWMNWGTTLNGSFSTQKIGECRKTGSVCTLSDILEDVEDEKYFLSQAQMEKIVFQ